MAEKLGTFTQYEFNRDPMLEVMRKHQGNIENVLSEFSPGNRIDNQIVHYNRN